MFDGLIAEKGLKNVIQEKHEEIKKVYLNDSRPWIIGYSGGKDSTTVVQLVFNALSELPKEQLHKPVYIVSSDTLVENPLIIEYISSNMSQIEESAKHQDMPFTSHLVTPLDSDTFWVLLLGKGYPSPRQKFRWCTDRLKISPIDRFIKEKVDRFGEAIVVLGVRRSESFSRANVIDSHNIEGKILKKHSTTNNAFVYAPIEDFTLDDVWIYLQNVPSPWSGDHKDLLSLYRNSQDASECPIQVDKDAPSCGNSRFGCWVCTVVKEDKSLSGFRKNGHPELEPLVKFRNELYDIRENPEYRSKRRMNGSIYFIIKDGVKVQGLGPFNLAARKKLLEELLIAEKSYQQLSGTQTKLINEFELKLIRDHWLQDGDWEDSLPAIYKKVTGKNFVTTYDERPLFSSDELILLSSICEQEDVDPELIKKLINIENSYYGLKARSGVLNKIDSTLKQDWVHEEIVFEEEGVS
ncbi:DNA sulfur modification protein DndC [Anaerovirgula multivorans]|uniref:DNA sulfur modification protein DndC n=1 Tax=Anaerovirgula multivorans TaxID=312168 RepID=A0A239CJH3_9FIRM|nr:DNA phosphorothioation system sulfurtransferase DndC [Anaerovirgula multivorans]SNS20386.1 DNA sulfur modification protein DndC [Anaerovirgula multivorans]